MTPKQIERLTATLWRKYARADRHGYQDDMCADSFANAIGETVAFVTSRVKTLHDTGSLHSRADSSGRVTAGRAK